MKETLSRCLLAERAAVRLPAFIPGLGLGYSSVPPGWSYSPHCWEGLGTAFMATKITEWEQLRGAQSWTSYLHGPCLLWPTWPFLSQEWLLFSPLLPSCPSRIPIASQSFNQRLAFSEGVPLPLFQSHSLCLLPSTETRAFWPWQMCEAGEAL